jgi:Peptidase family S49
VQIERIGKYKSAGDQLLRSDMSEPQREQLTALLDDVFDDFVSSVAEVRLQPSRLAHLLACRCAASALMPPWTGSPRSTVRARLDVPCAPASYSGACRRAANAGKRSRTCSARGTMTWTSSVSVDPMLSRACRRAARRLTR